MARRSRKTRNAAISVAIVVAAVAVYALFPYVASSNISSLKNDQQAYIYGTVEKREAYGNAGAFELNGSSGTVWVVWNGTMPADGQKVLVHGTIESSSLVIFSLKDFQATSVTPWPF